MNQQVCRLPFALRNVRYACLDTTALLIAGMYVAAVVLLSSWYRLALGGSLRVTAQPDQRCEWFVVTPMRPPAGITAVRSGNEDPSPASYLFSRPRLSRVK